jgi:hypothetical protein
MSKQFIYAQLNFTSKPQNDSLPATHKCAVVVEVPKRSLHCEHSESPTGNTEEKTIAIGIARITALGTFPKVGERVAGMYDEVAPIWLEERHSDMNKRPCDHELNGARAWRIV